MPINHSEAWIYAFFAEMNYRRADTDFGLSLDDGNDSIVLIGNDLAWGGAGNDTFVFGLGFDGGTIKDFEQGADLIDLSAIGGGGVINSIDDISMSQSGNHVIIDMPLGSITVENTLLSQMDFSDFIFSEPIIEPPIDGPCWPV